MAQDIISDALNQIMNAKKAGKPSVEVKHYSNFLLEILKIAKDKGYVDFKIDDKTKKLKIDILEVMECKTIKPRFYVKKDELEKYMRRYLPARGFGIVLVSTSKGLMTHDQVQEENIGGSLVAYFY